MNIRASPRVSAARIRATWQVSIKLSTNAIIGIAVGGGVLVLGVAVVICWRIARARAKQNNA